MENWHILYETDSGNSVSIGSVIVENIPSHLTSLPITDEQAYGLYHGLLYWDEQSRSLVETQENLTEANN
jgi:hypothetical protein